MCFLIFEFFSAGARGDLEAGGLLFRAHIVSDGRFDATNVSWMTPGD
jgi:hypothetical protein